jgi:hypothetical protein
MIDFFCLSSSNSFFYSRDIICLNKESISTLSYSAYRFIPNMHPRNRYKNAPPNFGELAEHYWPALKPL